MIYWLLFVVFLLLNVAQFILVIVDSYSSATITIQAWVWFLSARFALSFLIHALHGKVKRDADQSGVKLSGSDNLHYAYSSKDIIYGFSLMQFIFSAVMLLLILCLNFYYNDTVKDLFDEHRKDATSASMTFPFKMYIDLNLIYGLTMVSFIISLPITLIVYKRSSLGLKKR